MEHILIIDEVRKAKGISQNKLAAMCEISQGYLSALEKNTKSPTFRMLSKIAVALEVCPKVLIKCTSKPCLECPKINDTF